MTCTHRRGAPLRAVSLAALRTLPFSTALMAEFIAARRAVGTMLSLIVIVLLELNDANAPRPGPLARV